MSSKEIAWDKERSLFMQRIEHMEIRMSEIGDREGRLKDTHNKLLDTVQNIEGTDSNSKAIHAVLTDLKDELKMLRSNKDFTADGVTITDFRKNSETGSITPYKKPSKRKHTAENVYSK